MKLKKFDIFTDGACSGNPGLAAIAFVIKEREGIVKEFSKGIGTATNNIAEYTAVIYALQEALILKADRVVLHTDSELLCRQVAGRYKVKDSNLKPLFEQTRHLMGGFKNIEIKHIPREQNKDADRLAKKRIKTEQAKMVVPPA